MPLGKEQVERIARLARLNLSPDEMEKFTRELTVIVDYFQQLRRIDTTGVKPKKPFVTAENALREDQVTPSLPREEALRNAPDSDGEFFFVPKVMG